MKPFFKRLEVELKSKKNPLCVGLDPRFGNLPPEIRAATDTSDPESIANSFETFCKSIIDVVADLVPIVKPQIAFFEVLGWHGLRALGNIVQYARGKDLLVVMDAKRGDIGSTAQAYAQTFLGQTKFGESIISSSLQSDALTINPYLGDDSLKPFIDLAVENNAGLFLLVKTSNPGGKMIQDLIAESDSQSRKIYQVIAEFVQDQNALSDPECEYGPIGSVVGATYPEELSELRALMPNSWFLIPGFGAQGGKAKDIAGGFDANGLGAIVNSSRGINFAYENEKYAQLPNWQDAVRQATEDSIEQLREHTPAGKL